MTRPFACLLLCAASAAIAGCNGTSTVPPPVVAPTVAPTAVPTPTATPSAFIATQLYVSTAGIISTQSLLRYPLHDGVPGATPELVYQQELYPQFTARPDGSLYAIAYSPGPFILDSFAPNVPTPAAMLTLPTLYGTFYSGLTVDAAGYIYTENTYGGTIRRRSGRAERVPHPLASSGCTPSQEPYIGLLVYAPHASGSDGPIRCFDAGDAFQYNSIAIDSRGTLYVPQQDSRPPTIAEIDTPRTHPHVIRTLKSPSFSSITGIAIDSDDRLWVLNSSGYKHPSSSIQDFAPYADGDAKPDGTLANSTEQLWYGNVAVDDKYLYIGGAGEVLVYEKTAKGKRAPLASLKVDALMSSESGPFIAVSK